MFPAFLVLFAAVTTKIICYPYIFGPLHNIVYLSFVLIFVKTFFLLSACLKPFLTDHCIFFYSTYFLFLLPLSPPPLLIFLVHDYVFVILFFCCFFPAQLEAFLCLCYLSSFADCHVSWQGCSQNLCDTLITHKSGYCNLKIVTCSLLHISCSLLLLLSPHWWWFVVFFVYWSFCRSFSNSWPLFFPHCFKLRLLMGVWEWYWSDQAWPAVHLRQFFIQNCLSEKGGKYQMPWSLNDSLLMWGY